MADFGIEGGPWFLMGWSWLFERRRFHQQLRDMVQGLACPPMPRPGMNALFGRDRRDRFSSLSISSTTGLLKVAECRLGFAIVCPV